MQSCITLKYAILFLLVALIGPISGFSQVIFPNEEKPEIVKPRPDYKAWVKTINDSPKLKGRFLDFDGNTFLFRKKFEKTNSHLNSSNIEYIKLRKNGSIGRGIFAGAMVGLSAGAVVGYSQGDDQCDWLCIFSYTKEEKALLGGIVGSVSGAIIGGLLGAVKVKIPVGKDLKRAEDRLKKYRYF